MGRTSLYRHFDVKGDLLYVGISNNHLARLQTHKSGSHWFWKIARVEIEHFATRKRALEEEARAIEAEKPKHNGDTAVLFKEQNPDIVQVNVRIPESLMRRLDEEAIRKGRTKTAQLCRILDRELPPEGGDDHG